MRTPKEAFHFVLSHYSSGPLESSTENILTPKEPQNYEQKTSKQCEAEENFYG